MERFNKMQSNLTLRSDRQLLFMATHGYRDTPSTIHGGTRYLLTAGAIPPTDPGPGIFPATAAA